MKFYTESYTTGYGLDDKEVGIRVPVGAGMAHPAAYPMGTGGSVAGGKAAGSSR
jgi:hypothetical protein